MRPSRANFTVQASCAALILLCGACHKRPRGPSVHYDNGSKIYQELYVHELDDAFLDPKMDAAVAELKLVEPDSVSRHLADDLLAQIAQGRKDAIAVRDARAKALAASQQPQAIDPSQVFHQEAQAAQAAQEAADADAGAVVDPYGPGAPIAAINKDTGGCLVAGTPFREDGSGKTGATYKLADDPVCKTKLPGFANQTVLALDGRIYRRVANSEVKADKVLPGAPLFSPDGGVPQPNPAPAVPVPGSDATSVNSNVAGQQDATPRPAPPTTPRANVPSGATSTSTNVAADQNATPQPAPIPPVQPAQVEDATPPPAQ